MNTAQGLSNVAEAPTPDASLCHARYLTTVLFWTSDQPLAVGQPYLLRHSSQKMCAVVSSHLETLDVGTLRFRELGVLGRSGVGRVIIETQRPLACAPYAGNDGVGTFLLIDPPSGETLAVGLIEDAGEAPPEALRAPSRPGAVVWLTGLSSAGKTTLGQDLCEKLRVLGLDVDWLDGDVVRKRLTKDLGFSKEDRDENIRRVGFVAELAARKGGVAVVTFISPYRSIRDEVRGRIPNFIEVYVNAPLEVCEMRDVKGLYKKARAGLLKGFTGIDDPYEPPLNPEIECRTDLESVEDCTRRIADCIVSRLAG